MTNSARPSRSSDTPFVLIVGDAVRRGGSLEPAFDAAGARGVPVASPSEIGEVLDALAARPLCVVVDGEQSVVSTDSRLLDVPVVARVGHPSETAFLAAVEGGADDVVIERDVGSMTRRLSILAQQPEGRPFRPRGLALVADASARRRALIGRALRRSGLEVRYAHDASSAGEVLRSAEPAVVVLHESLLEPSARAQDWVRDVVDDHLLPVVVLQDEYAPGRGGHRVECTGWLPADAGAQNVTFIVNELLSLDRAEHRASPRVLYGTVCSFRRLTDLVPEYALTYNLSRDGIYVRTLQPPEVGSTLWLELRPPQEVGVVHLRGVVAWRCLAGQPSPSPPGFALHIFPQLCPIGDLERYRARYARLAVPIEAPSDHLVIPESAPRKARSARVLIADDEEAVRLALRRVLSERGIDVTLTGDGDEAVRAFRQGGFDAVITDIEMPRLDGIGLLRAIRAHDDQVPVIILTGNPTAETAIRALDHGALRYLVKPFDRRELESVVEESLGLARLARFRREAARVVSETGVVELAARRGLEGALDRALEGLRVAMQPIVDHAARRAVAFEALVRTSEPALPHPGALFDAAQRLNRIHEVSRRIRALAAESFAERTESLFVNLHPRDLVDEDLYDPAAPLSAIASRVVLEITERATLDDIGDLRDRVERLRGLGFRIAVDDLGAGYSGLSTFCALHPEVVKIDMSLVREVHHTPMKQRLVRSLVEACHDLDIVLVAEGVEVAEELRTLEHLGCDRFQGYLFARPGPPFPEVSWVD